MRLEVDREQKEKDFLIGQYQEIINEKPQLEWFGYEEFELVSTEDCVPHLCSETFVGVIDEMHIPDLIPYEIIRFQTKPSNFSIRERVARTQENKGSQNTMDTFGKSLAVT